MNGCLDVLMDARFIDEKLEGWMVGGICITGC